MFKLTAEEKIILLLSRLNPSTRALGEASALINDRQHPPDYERMTLLASSNGVSPLLYNNIRHENPFPDAVRERLRHIYLRNIKSNILKNRELVEVLKILRDHGVKAMPIKGAFASDVTFKNIGIYPAADIDILIHPSDMDRSEKAMGGAGYRNTAKNRRKDFLLSHYHLVFQKGAHPVELHWNLVKRYFHIDPGFWWDDAGRTTYEGVEIYTLSPEKYIMYTVFRLFSHRFKPLKFFILIDAVMNAHKDKIDYSRLLILSREYGMEKLVTFTLKFLNDVLGVSVPEKIAGKKIYGYDKIKNIIISDIFYGEKNPHLRVLIYTSLLGGPVDFIINLVKRIFPRQSEIRLRYGIPVDSKKVYLYYVLNPFLLIIGKGNSSYRKGS